MIAWLIISQHRFQYRVVIRRPADEAISSTLFLGSPSYWRVCETQQDRNTIQKAIDSPLMVARFRQSDQMRVVMVLADFFVRVSRTNYGGFANGPASWENVGYFPANNIADKQTYVNCSAWTGPANSHNQPICWWLYSTTNDTYPAIRSCWNRRS